MPDKVARTILKYDVDKSSLSAVISSTQKAQASLEALNKAGKIDPKQYELAAAKVNKFSKELTLAQKDLEATNKSLAEKKGDEYLKAEAKAARLQERIIKLNQELDDTPAKLEAAADKAAELAVRSSRIDFNAGIDATRKRVDSFGDTESQTRTITGAIGTLGGDAGAQVEQIANMGAELFAVAEAAPLLAASLSANVSAIAANVPLVGTLSAEFLTLAPTLGATGAAIGAITAVALPIAVIAGAAALAVDGFNKELARAKEAAESAAAARRRATELELENVDAVKERSSEENRLEFERNAERLKVLQESLEKEQALLAENQAKFEALGASFNPFERSRLGDEANIIKENIKALQDQFIELGEVQDNVFQVLQPAIDAREKEENAIRSQLAAIRDAVDGQAQLDILSKQSVAQLNERQAAITAEIAAIQDSVPALAELAKTSDDAKQEFEAYGERLKALQKEQGQLKDALPVAESREAAASLATFTDSVKRFAEQQASVADGRALRDSRDQEDFQEQQAASLKAHRDKLLSIEADGQAKIAAIRGNIADLPAQLAEAQGKAQGKANDAISKVNADFMQSEIKALEKFRADEAKRVKAFNTQRLRDLEDLNNDLLDAEQSNDVLRFLQIQKAGETRLKRQDEDNSAAQQEAQDSFLAEREAARQARETRVAEIQAGLAQELTAIQQANAEKNAELQKALAAEKAAIQERLAAEKASFDEREKAEAASREKRLRRQAEDDQRADQQAQQALQKELQRIGVKEQAELKALDSVIAKANSLSSSISKSSTSGKSSLSSALSNLDTKKGKSFTQALGFAFEKEGIARRATIGLVGENLKSGEAEAMIRFKESEGLPAEVFKRAGGIGGGGGITVAPVFNSTIGDIATAAQVTEALNAYTEALAETVGQAVQLARYQPKAG